MTRPKNGTVRWAGFGLAIFLAAASAIFLVGKVYGNVTRNTENISKLQNQLVEQHKLLIRIDKRQALIAVKLNVPTEGAKP